MWCCNSQLDSLILGANLLWGFPAIFPLCTEDEGCDPSGRRKCLRVLSPKNQVLLHTPLYSPRQLFQTHLNFLFGPEPCNLDLGDLVAKFTLYSASLKM